MLKAGQGISCYEVMPEVQAVIQEVLPGAPVFLVGGGPAAAIGHEATRYDHDSKRVIATTESAESTMRPNGSLRDLDLVAMRLLGHDEGRLAEQAILEAINHRMVVSVFGLEPRQGFTPGFRFARSFADWTSRRTIDEDGIHRYEIYPLQQVVDRPDVVYEEWALELPTGGEISIMPPDTTVLNYSIRSVSPRAKDKKKIALMRQNVEAEPEFVERIHGPLQPIQELADAIVALGNNSLDKSSPLLAPGVCIVGFGMFRAKAGLNTTFGKYDRIVKIIGHNEAVQSALKFATGRK